LAAKVWKWHIADDVLVGSKVRYVWNFSAATSRDAASGIGARLPLLRVPAKVSSPCFADLHHQDR
jgi:hypothetical protein